MLPHHCLCILELKANFFVLENVNKTVYLNFNVLEQIFQSFNWNRNTTQTIFILYYLFVLQSCYIYDMLSLAFDYLAFHCDLLAFTMQLSISKISLWKEVLVKSGTSGYFVLYYKLPGANFIWKCNNCSCITAAMAIPCAVFGGICFLF